MNEIELQKALVKEAFNTHKNLPDFGGIGEEGSLKLRNYIWKVCGFLEHESPKRGHDPSTLSTQSSKKHGLVTSYKLWSAFTKNIRYNVDQKCKAVTLPRFGTFARSQDDPLKATFTPSVELAAALGVDRSSEPTGLETAQPEW